LAQQGKTTIQVVPYSAGAHAGTIGAFVILDFPEPTGWLLLAAVALTVTVSVAAASAVSCPSGTCAKDPAKISLTGIYLGQAVVAIVAVLAISSEYGTGLIRVTLTAMLRRITVLAAKAAILTGLVLAAGTIAVGASLLAGRLILPCNGIGPATAARCCP
jgi:ABC-2 type transport system permease protein